MIIGTARLIDSANENAITNKHATTKQEEDRRCCCSGVGDDVGATEKIAVARGGRWRSVIRL